MTPINAVINSRAYDGSIRRSWNCELLRQDGQLLEFVGVFETGVDHTDLGHIAAETTSYEYYWLDRWYNIFRFHEPDGRLRNHYCNINMPPKFENGVLDYVDLDLDVVVWPDGEHAVLDRKEFEQNSRILGYPPSVVATAERALSEILEIIQAGGLPT